MRFFVLILLFAAVGSSSESIERTCQRLLLRDLQLGDLQEAAWKARAQGDGALADQIEQRLERVLSTERVVARIALKKGSTNPSLVTLESGVQAVFKPDRGLKQSKARYEVAAYRLDRLLGDDAVPVTVDRVIESERGSLQYYVARASDGQKIFQLWGGLAPQILLLDYLDGNQDRGPANYLIAGRVVSRHLGFGKKIAIDNGYLFRRERTPVSLEYAYERVPDLKTYESLKALRPEVIQKQLGRYLTREEQRYLLVQREQLLKPLWSYFE